MSLDYCAEQVALKSPNFFRAIMMAPREKRPKLLALIGLDIELWTAKNASNEEMINAIRLAWWSEELPKENPLAHPVIAALIEANVNLQLAKQIVTAYQEERESLPIIIREFSRHLGANEEDMIGLMHAIGEKRHKPQHWPKAARPIVAMLVPVNRFQAAKLVMFGKA